MKIGKDALTDRELHEQIDWLKELTDKELKEEAIALYESIYVTECYGIRDMFLYEKVLAELRNRGYTVQERIELIIEKEE